jgi:hypothetical protein
VLDRAVVLQQLGLPKLSARDLQLADKSLELFDFSRSGADEVARFLFSDDAGPYLMINTLNLVNYLVLGDVSGAKVEARRFALLQNYLKEAEPNDTALLGPGSYLAGFAFEKAGDRQTAARFYREAQAAGPFPSLQTPLAAQSQKPQTGAALAPEQHSDVSPASTQNAELLFVVNYGRVPAKEAMRIPLGLALEVARQDLSPMHAAIANEQLARGAVIWVNFPTLPKPGPVPYQPLVRVDGKVSRLDIVSIDALVVEAWRRRKGRMIASAIVRALSRAAAGAVTEKAVGGGLGLAISLLGQAALVVSDTPDTRCWATLPARFGITRVQVPAGSHQIEFGVPGHLERRRIELAPGEWRAFSATNLSQ